jgi:hypothetical protein
VGGGEGVGVLKGVPMRILSTEMRVAQEERPSSMERKSWRVWLRKLRISACSSSVASPF